MIDRDAPGFAETIRAGVAQPHAARDPHARRVRHPRAHADRQLPRATRRRSASRGRSSSRRSSTPPRRSSVSELDARRASARRYGERAGARRRHARAEGRARRSASSGRTAPARRRCCACWPRCCARTPAACRCWAASCPTTPGRCAAASATSAHEPLLYRDLSARENLRFHARLHGVGRARAWTSCSPRSASTGRADEPVRELSRGMVQRAAAARAVLHDPPLLLLDEPRANLDPAAAELLEPLIGRACGRTRVLVTHDVEGGARRGRRRARAAARPAGVRAAGATREPSVRGAVRVIRAASRSCARTSRSSCARAQSVPAMALFSVTAFVLFHFGLDRDRLDGDLASGVAVGDAAARDACSA